jgi:LmbE family N-acetylglucosaminyl deacetylase
MRGILCNDGRQSHVLALSPHPDDVAFSCGGLLRRLCSLSTVTIVTVFTKSKWSPMLDLDDAERITEQRCAEDRSFAGQVNARLRHLGWRDSGLRGYDDLSERSAYYDQPEEQSASFELLSVIDEERPEWILAPLALGNHVDHLVVRDTVMFCKRSEMNICFYEDLPYSDELSEPQIEQHVSACAGSVAQTKISLTTDEFDMKLATARLYTSQVREQDTSAIRRHALRTGGGSPAERVWIKYAGGRC